MLAATQGCSEHHAHEIGGERRGRPARHAQLQRRVGAALLLTSLMQTATAGYTSPDAAVDALWEALSHEAGEAPDAAALEAVLDERAVVFGSRFRASGLVLTRHERAEFIDRLRSPRPYRFAECEVGRSVTVEGPFAAVKSWVMSAKSEELEPSTFVGINSVQLHQGASGWVIVSLYYHVLPEMPARFRDAGSRCKSSAAADRTK